MKYYKVYEIIKDNYRQVGLKDKVCVGIFKSEDRAKYLCYVIDVQDCNQTEIVFGEVTKSDIVSLHKCYKGSDCEDEVIKISKELFKSDEKTLTK